MPRTHVRRKWWYMQNYLVTHPCIDCGETNVLTLEFDHRNKEEKTMSISQAVWKMDFDTFKKEIEKCDVRCANDHKIRHRTEDLFASAEERGVWTPGD